MTTAAPSRTGRKAGVTVSPEAMRKALDGLMAAPTIEARTLAVLFGIGVQAAYTAARQGRFGAQRFGGSFRFPSAIVREALGLAPMEKPTSEEERDTS